jgi:hypothetical protein
MTDLWGGEIAVSVRRCRQAFFDSSQVVVTGPAEAPRRRKRFRPCTSWYAAGVNFLEPCGGARRPGRARTTAQIDYCCRVLIRASLSALAKTPTMYRIISVGRTCSIPRTN